MSGKRSRDKGKRGELEAAALLSKATGVEVKRVFGQARQGDEAPDIDGPGLAYCVEVKNQRTVKLGLWWEQTLAVADVDGREPMLLIKLDRRGWVKVTRL